MIVETAREHGFGSHAGRNIRRVDGPSVAVPALRGWAVSAGSGIGTLDIVRGPVIGVRDVSLDAVHHLRDDSSETSSGAASVSTASPHPSQAT